jgi:hypothetical protein
MLPQIKKARLSALALSASLKIKEDASREFFAQAIEHETWAGFIALANKKQSSEALDNELSPDIANNRLGQFANNLSMILELHHTTAKTLAAAINPFSQKKPKPYRIDTRIDKHASDDKDSLNVFEMMDSAGGEEAMLAMLHEIGNKNPELAKLKDITDFNDFANRMRISHPMEPGVYYDCIDNLTNWELNDTFYEEEYSYLKESFHLVSSFDGVSYPVYLVSLTAVPGDSGDEIFDEIKQIIGKKGERALLLFRHPSYKELNGTTFAVIGAFYDKKRWCWTLLAKDDPETQAKRITPENFDLESPVLDSNLGVFKSQGVSAHIIYQGFVCGHLDPETGTLKLPKKCITTTGVSGWCSSIY